MYKNIIVYRSYNRRQLLEHRQSKALSGKILVRFYKSGIFLPKEVLVFFSATARTPQFPPYREK